MASASMEDIRCPICMEDLSDPVSVDCGHSFCRGCITQYFKIWEEQRDLKCPLCKAKITKGNFRPNWQLARIVEKMKHLGKEDLCVRHKEKLHLFCKEDQKLVCLICERSPEHQSHTVLLLEEAAKEYKGQFRSSLVTLKKERTNILTCKADTEKESKDMLMQTKAEREKSAAAFRQLHQFLEEQEKNFLAHMEEVEMEIAGRRDKHLAGLSAELSSLDRLIRELEEKQQQSANEFLQDVGSTLQRCEKRETFGNPVAFPPALKWRTWETCDTSPFLERTIKQFKDTLESGMYWQNANMTLNPVRAHSKLILSEDGKSVRVRDECQDLPNNPKVTWPLVVGCEGFTAGRHSWEVTVGSEGDWAVGVTRKTLWNKNKVVFRPQDGVCVFGNLGGQYKAYLDSGSYLVLVDHDFQRIRVALDYPEEQVAFFNADTGVCLFTFWKASFCGETLLPFFSVKEGGHLILSLPESVTGSSSQAQLLRFSRH